MTRNFRKALGLQPASRSACRPRGLPRGRRTLPMIVQCALSVSPGADTWVGLYGKGFEANLLTSEIRLGGCPRRAPRGFRAAMGPRLADSDCCVTGQAPPGSCLGGCSKLDSGGGATILECGNRRIGRAKRHTQSIGAGRMSYLPSFAQIGARPVAGGLRLRALRPIFRVRECLAPPYPARPAVEGPEGAPRLGELK